MTGTEEGAQFDQTPLQVCPSCRKKVSSAASILVFVGIVMVIVSLPILAIFPHTDANIIEKLRWDSMETVSIEDITPNEVVKISGTISAEGNVVFRHNTQIMANGKTEKLIMMDDFVLVDSSGEILIKMDDFRFIREYAHWYEGSNFTDYWYENGDRISTIGEASYNETGHLVFHAKIITLADWGFYLDFEIKRYSILGSFIIVGSIIACVNSSLLFYRKRVHSERGDL